MCLACLVTCVWGDVIRPAACRQHQLLCNVHITTLDASMSSPGEPTPLHPSYQSAGTDKASCPGNLGPLLVPPLDCRCRDPAARSRRDGARDGVMGLVRRRLLVLGELLPRFLSTSTTPSLILRLGGYLDRKDGGSLSAWPRMMLRHLPTRWLKSSPAGMTAASTTTGNERNPFSPPTPRREKNRPTLSRPGRTRPPPRHPHRPTSTPSTETTRRRADPASSTVRDSGLESESVAQIQPSRVSGPSFENGRGKKKKTKKVLPYNLTSKG